MSLLLARRGILAAGAAPPAPDIPPGDDYAAAVAADEPDWWLRFEEVTGSTVADEVGTNDGTVTGANLNVGSFAATGSAIEFDGVNDKVDVPHDALLNAGATFTFECLLKLNDPAAGVLQMVADKTAGTGGQGQWLLFWDNRDGQGNPLRLRFACYGGTTNVIRNQADWSGTTARDALAAGIHLAGTFDVNEDVSVRLYVDGTEVATSASGAALSPDPDNDRAVEIANLGGSFWLAGVLDEIAIYHKVLSPARIAVHAQEAGLAS